MEGILLIDKDKNMTSRDVVNKLNHIFSMKRIGHTGTLDPLATGVLVVALGKYTKLVNELTCMDKEYIAEIKLGIKTDTGDITGNVINEKEYNHITLDMVKDTLNSFLGTYMQTVPIYSAVKVNGKKLYEYARNNIDVELPKREVTISNIELISFEDDKIVFKVSVSKGTYIRALIEDICEKMNTYGTMANLRRTRQGKFKIEECVTLEDVINNNYNLLNVEECFNYPIVNMDDKLYKLVSNGVYIDNIFNIKDKVLFNYNNKNIAIYRLDNKRLKPEIML